MDRKENYERKQDNVLEKENMQEEQASDKGMRSSKDRICSDIY
jgi:hypothetical protein